MRTDYIMSTSMIRFFTRYGHRVPTSKPLPGMVGSSTTFSKSPPKTLLMEPLNTGRHYVPPTLVYTPRVVISTSSSQKE